MLRNAQSSSVRSATATFLGIIMLTACSSTTQKSAPAPTSSRVVDIREACNGALRAGTKAAQEVLGASRVVPGPAQYQAAITTVASRLRADIPEGGGLATVRHLCAVQPSNSTAWLRISFRWEPYHAVPPLTTSSIYSTEYRIGYAASSRDNDALIDFTCRVPNADRHDGRGMYILAAADTQGLNSLAPKQKREAQLRVLHAASVSVAAALHCSTNLPTKLGALTPLPLAD